MTSKNGLKAKIKVKVVAKKPAKAKKPKITIKGVKKALKVGAVAYAKATFKPASAVGAKVTYKSNKPKVLKVDKAGRVLALAKGKANLTVKVGKATKRTQAASWCRWRE